MTIEYFYLTGAVAVAVVFISVLTAVTLWSRN